MTCIVGIEDGEFVYMGGDSAGAAGYDLSIQVEPKVFQVGKFLIGYTSSFRMGQILQYNLSVKPQEQESDFAYMVSVVVEAVRDTLKQHGYSHVENNVEEGGVFLIGYNGRLYVIQDDFSVLHRSDRFNAVGCGASYALASMWEHVAAQDNPEHAITEALKCAEHFSCGVRGPFVVKRI